MRIEGRVQKLEPIEFKHIYDREPLYCKIRSHLCHQDRPVDWDDLKCQHDEILQEYQRGENTLPMPNHLYVNYF